MTETTDLPLADLQEYAQPIAPEDNMAEAGRKILLKEFIRMLKHESGSRTGTDIEDVHQMRVATRRMRSAFRLLDAYYRDKPTRPFARELKRIARRLGSVRDLDVMIEDLSTYNQSLAADTQPHLQPLFNKLEKRRQKARKKLVKYLDSKDYQSFIRNFTDFLTSPGSGTHPIQDESTPHQVRHVLPTLIHEKLAAVRAYDTVAAEAPAPILHALRIEFKRLRYTVEFFKGVLGSSASDYISEIKVMQDYLGRLNDFHVAAVRLDSLMEDVSPDEEAHTAIQTYIDELQAKESDLVANFYPAWEQFNKRTVQRKLSDALLVLR
ncbi:MAG: CHAD domain-containing protein [Chloroflexota bacterium]